MKCRSKSTDHVHAFDVDNDDDANHFPSFAVRARGVPRKRPAPNTSRIDATSYVVCSPGIPEPETSSEAYATAYTPQSFQFVCGVLETIDIGSFPMDPDGLQTTATVAL